MAALTHVQTKSGENTSAVLTITLTFDSTATEDNLLFAAVNVRAGGNTFNTPTGWTLINEYYTGATGGGATFYKVSDGTETAVTLSWVSDSGDPTAVFLEYSGNTATPLDASNEDETNISTSVTSQSSSAATATASDGLAIAAIMPRTSQAWDLVETYTNSFTERFHHSTTANIGGLIIAELAYTTTGSKSTTASTTDSGSECYGSIQLFEAAADGGPVAGTLSLTGVGI